MARNKYPEVTVERILDVSQRLFLEKGYEHTTIQDIVDGLGGLTKGAVYHHFKSKEEILDAVSDRMFFTNNPFEAVRKRSDLSGLEKLREVVRLNQGDHDRVRLTVQAIPITQNPKLLVEMIRSNREVLTPYFQELLEEGNRDGSIHTKYARELAELLPLLTSLWLLPAVFCLAAAMNLLNWLHRYRQSGRDKRKKAAAAAHFVIAVLLAAVTVISAISIWR